MTAVCRRRLGRTVWKLDSYKQPAQSPCFKLHLPSPGLDDISHNPQTQAVAAGLLIQTGAAAEHLITLAFRNARAIVLHLNHIPLRGLAQAQLYLGIGPFAGVVQQIAEQLEHVLAIPGQQQARRNAVRQLQMLAVDHPQGRQQPRQLCIRIELRTRQGITCQARTVELAAHALLYLLQLLTQCGLYLGITSKPRIVGQADQHR